MKELKQYTLKVRVKELEARLNNLKALVDNIAFNQEQIVKAFEVDAEVVEPSKEVCDDPDCECNQIDKCNK